ncbi:hypothetical protein [Maledivibacter halophilus]|uniref:hypothetical protein n=1 Tax=Maledivibacter halophilus TaxID=36842 RepID=UPI001AD8DC0D|nr:hypothetical protein [Maledivibacter halophilus]
MNEVLNSIYAEYVPMTICLDKGIVIKAFSGENMVTNIKNYFDSKEGSLFLKKLNPY